MELKSRLRRRLRFMKRVPDDLRVWSERTRRRISKREPDRCVAFVVEALASFEIYEPVVRAMRDVDWDVAIVVTPAQDQLHRFSDDGYDLAAVRPTWEAIAARGFTPEPLLPADAEAQRLRDRAPTAVFVPLPYDTYLHSSLTPARLGLPVHYVNYGFNLQPSWRGLEFELPFYRRCDAIYTENDYCTEQYARAGVKRSRLVKSGSPALDHWDVDRKRADCPTILWCPHWTLHWPTDDKTTVGYSTFIPVYQAILDEAARRPHMRFAIRAHQLMWSELRREGRWTEQEELAFHARIAELDNVTVNGIDSSTGKPTSVYPSHVEQFEQAWAMVTDGVSFLAEFGYTGKPVLLTHARGNPGWNPVGQAICDVVHRSESHEGLAAFLDHVERGIDPDGEKRREVIRGLFYRPPGGSATAIQLHLEEVIARRE